MKVNATSDKETAMTTWVYKCSQCGITFAIEVAEGAQPPLTATCPQCGSTEATKQFELSQPSGGCSCGGGCC
jgi:putative FmdB family regulatory protein